MRALKPWSRAEDWTNLILGAYLFLVPWFFSATDNGSAAWNSWIFGAVIVILALWALGAARSEGAEWLDAIAGLWVLISPFALGFTGEAGVAVSSYIVGAVVLVLSIVAQQRVHRATNSGGGLSAS